MAASELVEVRLKVQDRNKFIADMTAMGYSVKGFAKETANAGKQMKEAGGHGWWFNQALFTLRRTVFAGTIALAGMGAAAIALGLQFNNSMDQARIAFTRFLGSPAAAQVEIEKLYKFAADTPFEFAGLVDATKQLLAFNFTVKEVNALIPEVSDAIAGMGLGQDGIQRTVLALGQMHSAGRILGQDLRQLMELGLVDPQDFMKRTGISQDQFANIGALNMPSKVGIDAITAYWKEKFGGASADFQKTWQGRLSTLHDYSSKLFGDMIRPLQNRLKDELFPSLTKIAQIADQGFNEGGLRGAVKAVDDYKNSGGRLLMMYDRIVGAGTAFVNFLKTVIGLFVDSWKILGIALIPALFLLEEALNITTFALEELGPVLKPLIALLLAYRIALLAVWAAQKLVNLVEWISLGLLWLLKAARKSYEYWVLRTEYAEMLLTKAVRLRNRAEEVGLALQSRGAKLWASSITLLKAATAATIAFTKRIWMMVTAWIADAAAATAAWLASLGPIGWLIAAVIAVIAVLTLLYYKWGWFHKAVDATFNFIKDHWMILAGILITPFGLAVIMIVKHFGAIKDAALDLYHYVAGLFKKLGNIFHNVWSHIPGHGLISGAAHLVGLANGGQVTQTGAFVVGERGREVVTLPRGAAVSPISTKEDLTIGTYSGGGSDKTIELHSHLYLDGKEIAERVEEVNLDIKARG